ncbi:hypothetical protein GH714_005472 [Hevea brasiliensis]|uniref:Reverse transcriptase Ty1/copia-type domain-containing protein n=1 Tax=Hevea brasiliensis TaxID=3981 RepID=A0A6A6KC57_HEVBR|nr:hypothetical protein GH714_005472 [Hevea brasiliensis]
MTSSSSTSSRAAIESPWIQVTTTVQPHLVSASNSGTNTSPPSHPTLSPSYPNISLTPPQSPQAGHSHPKNTPTSTISSQILSRTPQHSPNPIPTQTPGLPLIVDFTEYTSANNTSEPETQSPQEPEPITQMNPRPQALIPETNVSNPPPKPRTHSMELRPNPPKKQFYLSQGTPLPNLEQYRQIVGALQYMTLTRPDIAFSVNKLAQFLHCATDVHSQAAKRLLRYINGTPHVGLHITKQSTMQLQCVADSDWVGCPDDRRSTNGYLVYLGAI